MYNFLLIAYNIFYQKKFFTLFIFLTLAPFAFFKAVREKRTLTENQNAERKHFFKYTMY